MGKTYVGLLRAVNLAGLNKVGMGELRNLLEALGLQRPQTLLQSGNVVFRSDMTTARLEELLQHGAAKRLGIKTDFFVRNSAEWKAIISANPFPKEARRDPAHLLMMALKDAPARAAVAALQAAIKGREVIEVGDRAAYIIYPDGIGRSRLTTALIEQKLGTRGTGRNWNTVLKLGALAGL